LLLLYCIIARAVIIVSYKITTNGEALASLAVLRRLRRG
jgi:hypothetical protein